MVATCIESLLLGFSSDTMQESATLMMYVYDPCSITQAFRYVYNLSTKDGYALLDCTDGIEVIKVTKRSTT